MNSLDLRSLEIFRAVAAEGSVSRAAERLNRVQSNVSTRIKQLEDRLDRPLFHRGNRGLTLTADGHRLLSYADRLLQLSEEAAEAMNESRPSVRFRIGTMESTAAARLPGVLSAYHREFPDVEIEVTTDVAQGLVERLQGYDVDVAFIAEPVQFEGLATLPVFEEELVLVAPQSFPPLERIEEISGRTVVAFEPGCAYRRYLEEWLLEAGIVPGGVLAVGSYLAILACVSAGTGFAVVPRAVLEVVTSSGSFRTYDLAGKMTCIRTMMTWRRDYRSTKLDALQRLLPSI